MSEQVDFDAAFGETEVSTDDVIEVAESQEEVPAGDESTDVVAEAEDGVPLTDGEPAETEVAAEAAPAVETPVAETPAPVVEQPQQMPQIDPKYLAQAIAEEQERRQREAQATQQEQKQEKEVSYEDFLTEEQKASIKLMDTEWSEVAGPVHALINAHVQAALAKQEKQVLAQVQQRLAPIEQVTAQSQEALYWSTIQASHPDFREAAAAIPEWIEKQPKLVQPALRTAYERGTAEQVIELLDTYKQAIGTTGAAPAQPASSAAQVPPKAVPQEALAATLAPPTAQRSKMAPSRDPNDAEAAFVEAFGS